MQKNNPIYFIRSVNEYEDLESATSALKYYTNPKISPANYEIGSYIPPPRYKSWVPKFLIKLITK